MDGDGDLDAVVATSTGDLRWYAALAGGALSAAQIIDPTPQAPFKLVLADVDGDGRLDVAAACYNTASLRVWRNLGSGGFAGDVSMSGVVDHLRDGDLDALWCADP